MKHPSLLQRLAPFFVVTFWGSAIVLSALAMRDISPMATAFWRWCLALPALWAALIAGGQGRAAWRWLRDHVGAALVIGLTGMTLLYGLQNMALHYTTAFNTGLLIELSPIFIALLAWLWLQEWPAPMTWFGISLGFLGAGALAAGNSGEFQVGLDTVRGDLMAIGAAFSAAVYTVYGKRLLKSTTPLIMLTVGATAGVMQLAPLAALEGDMWPSQPQTWLWLALLGWGAGAFGNLWWFRMLEYTEAARASVFLFATALVSAALAVLILGDPLTAGLLAGGALIIAGVRLVHREQTPPEPNPAQLEA